MSNNLTSRAELITNTILDLFGNAHAEVNFVGASELLAMARRQQTFSLRLKFIESYISREGGNYIVLASLPSYFQFVTDEEGKLRRYLFESNVRDYLGSVQVNTDIRSTLDSKKNASEEDFWWFNNGVTVLGTNANVVGKEIIIENVQIVNGLQTTETIYGFYKENGSFEDNRAVLIKVLLAADEKTRARIIKATNYQNSVELSSLRGLDTVQRDIEHYLYDKGWYYDRRKNYYKNQGRPAGRIISIPYLAAAVRAVALRDPAGSQRQRSRSLRDDEIYDQVFSRRWDLNVYLASLEITHAVEAIIVSNRAINVAPPITLVHYIAFAYAFDKLGKQNYLPQDVASLIGCPPTTAEVIAISRDLKAASRDEVSHGRKYRGITLSKAFIESFVRQRFSDLALRAPGTAEGIDQPSSVLSTEHPASLEELNVMYKEVKRLGTPREVIAGGSTLVREAAMLLSAEEGIPYTGLRRTLLRAAISRGTEKKQFEHDVRILFIVYGKMRQGVEEVSESEAKGFLRTVERVLKGIGLELERASKPERKKR